MKKLNLNYINVDNLNEELELISEKITEQFGKVLHTTISWMRLNPVLPDFIIEGMNWRNTIPASLTPAQYGIDSFVTEEVYDGRNYNEENSLERASDNLWNLVEHIEINIDRNSELRKIANEYYKKLLLAKSNDESEPSLRSYLQDKVRGNRVSEFRFNKTEREFTEAVLKLIK